jgi:hypothetical protein
LTDEAGWLKEKWQTVQIVYKIDPATFLKRASVEFQEDGENTSIGTVLSLRAHRQSIRNFVNWQLIWPDSR